MSEKFSYSKLDTYEQCGFKYKLRYIDGNFLNTSNVSTEVGTMIHKAEERIANILKDNPTAVIDYTPIKNEIILKTAELAHKYGDKFDEKDKSGKTFHEKIYEYLDTGIKRLELQIKCHTGYKILAAEQPFLFNFHNKTFKGVIDRLIYDESRGLYIIQDIKTYAVPKEPNELEDIPLQFVIYIMAAMELYNITADKIVCQYDLPFCNCIQTAGRFRLNKKDTDSLARILTNIDDKLFSPNPSALCHWCEFCETNPNQQEAGKKLCPYYCLWTENNKTKKVAHVWEGLEKHEKVVSEFWQDK